MAMVVRANLEISEKPAGDKRMIFSGTIDQIKEDIPGCNDIGAHELFFDPTFSPGAQSLDRWLALMEQLRKLRRGLQASWPQSAGFQALLVIWSDLWWNLALALP